MAYTTVALTPLRKVIAARMTEAKQDIPHFRVVTDIEMDALLALRKQLNDEHPQQKISVNDFVLKACAMALMQWPAINSQWVDNEILQYNQADISVVVAVPGGLSTPVLREVDTKSVRSIADQVKTLAERAAKGQLKMNELTGGSFSVSNLGMHDVDQFDAIINPPQVAILAVSSAKPQPVVVDNSVVVKTIMRVSLSLDHRAVDGATGAGFLKTLKKLLQDPTQLQH